MSDAVEVSDQLNPDVPGGPSAKATGNTSQTKKVLLSADIDPNLYRELASWCQDVAF
ncbi:hypothetical protein AB6813_21485 [bacterium RCC_150]